MTLCRSPNRAALFLLLTLLAGAVAIWSVDTREPSGPSDRMIRPLSLPQEPDTPLRLAVFGTSLTANADWPEVVAATLSDCLNRRVQLSRIAQPGATSLWALDQVGQVAAIAPDVVLIEFAINDADLRDGLWLKDSITTHRALIRALQVGHPDLRIVLMTMNPAQGLRGLMRPGLARYYAAYVELARETGVGLIDLYPRWLALPEAARALRDGLHPDTITARAVIVPTLLPWLGTLAGRKCSFLPDTGG